MKAEVINSVRTHFKPGLIIILGKEFQSPVQRVSIALN